MELNLFCWADELSPSQLAVYANAEKESSNLKAKLQSLLLNGGEEIFSGKLFSAYQFPGYISEIESNLKKVASVPKEVKLPEKRQSRTPAAPRAAKRREEQDDIEEIPLVKKALKTKEENESPKREPPKDKKVRVSKTAEKEKKPPTLRPSEVSSIGGLTVGVEGKSDSGKPGGPDSKEMAFSKVQGKTFPSLVVLAKPSMKVKDSANIDRSALDSKVKIVLMLAAAKFTEWLIQQGLLKSEQKCAIHTANELKLGVYSDGSKFPYSGGYVWISECCPTRFVSVFFGSLFEGAPHPPSCILKLIYHWACQTNIQNVVQWVKVDNMYIKSVYTWLRAVCTAALHQHSQSMGGAGKYIEVGVISLGTTTQDGQQRQVKVEVLGVLDYAEKMIKLRAIEPFTDGEKNYKKRFAKILEPLHEWVSKDSIILTDLTVDRTTLLGMGYKNITQTSTNDKNPKNSNSNVMDYLRRIVPRMFQNTLSLLSRQMIQQFLDELVWREQYGTYPLQSFDNITKHISEQTRIENKETLVHRLSKVSTNPFKNWSHSGASVPESVTLPKKSPQESTSNQRKTGRKAGSSKGTSSPSYTFKGDVGYSEKSQVVEHEKKKDEETKRNRKEIKKDWRDLQKKIDIPDDNNEDDETIGFEDFYYGFVADLNYKYEPLPNFNGKCPECKKWLYENIDLQNHVLAHIVFSNQNDTLQCKYCLEKWPDEDALKKHVVFAHPIDTKNSISSTYNCIICENRFNSVQMLNAHMQRVHSPLELPYKCSGCNYRSSSHRKTIDHFYEIHKGTGTLQCPFCLMAFRVFANNRPINQNVCEYQAHIHKHMLKTFSKKCNKCSLSFVHKGSLKAHQLLDHKSHITSERKTQTLIESTIYIQTPKIKSQLPKDSSYTISETFKKIEFNVEYGKTCLECDIDFNADHPITGVLRCEKCRYTTCCLRAMLEHTSSCQYGVNPESNVHISLAKEMHCVCGFSSSDGNCVARHLAVCEHKSAYPSVEVAQDNTVKRNMLDMLGLVRRDEDSK